MKGHKKYIDKGRTAFLLGDLNDDNPYKGERPPYHAATARHSFWAMGWHQAFQEHKAANSRPEEE